MSPELFKRAGQGVFCRLTPTKCTFLDCDQVSHSGKLSNERVARLLTGPLWRVMRLCDPARASVATFESSSVTTPFPGGSAGRLQVCPCSSTLVRPIWTSSSHDWTDSYFPAGQPLHSCLGAFWLRWSMNVKGCGIRIALSRQQSRTQTPTHVSVRA